jgi:CDP-glucose 4,6-dehydratase
LVENLEVFENHFILNQYNFSFFEKAFNRKRVLVTGSTGFKGGWLSFILNRLGAQVVGFALPATGERNTFDQLALKNKIDQQYGDVCDADALSVLCRQFQPDYVFHLAAQAIVRKSYEDAVGTFKTNFLGSVHLLDAVANSDSAKALVFVTSDKCYENNEWIWGYRENDQLGGVDPYSASKAAAELAFSSYQRSFFHKKKHFAAASARAGNVIGGGDWAIDRIVPDCIRAIIEGEPITLRNPHSTRPWQHVLEPISGYLLLAERLYSEGKKYSGAWNFGPNVSECFTVAQITERLFQLMESGSFISEESATAPHEASLLQLNCEKAHRQLGWHPRWKTQETLQATAEWYRTFLSGDDIESVTKSQIERYFNSR